MKTLYEYLLDNYKENEPIFLADLQIDGMTRTNVRQQVKKLADTGKVRRFDNGIYFLPQKTFFKPGSRLAPEKVLVCKYLRDKDKRCGYVSGLMFFNQMGLTTQVTMTTLVSGTQKINAIKLGVRGFVRICIETCARGCFGAWKYRFRKKGMLIRQMLFICQK